MIPKVPSSEAVSEAATQVRQALSSLDETVESVTTEWNKISGVYEAPEAATVYTALNSLDTRPEELHEVLRSAASAIDDYATALKTLETSRTSLVERSESDDFATDTDFSTDLRQFENQINEADRDCATRLKNLRAYATSSPDIGPAALGLSGAAAVLEWHRGAIVLFNPGVTPPVQLTNPRPPTAGWDRTTHGGKPYVRTPGGLYVPESSVPPPEPPKVNPLTTHAKPVPPTWAKFGSRGLGALGSGFTLWGSWSTGYNESLVAHPEWGEDQHRNEALKHTVIVGGAEVAGAVGGGAIGGAAAGALIGSVIPGPGTVIGGIVGGVVGGLLGGWGGRKAGEAAKEHIFGG